MKELIIFVLYVSINKAAYKIRPNLLKIKNQAIWKVLLDFLLFLHSDNEINNWEMNCEFPTRWVT